jgi:hypothetical protein
MDERIGKHGGAEPKLCAVTGQEVPGKHSSHYSIGEGYYITILEKVAMRMSSNDIGVVQQRMKELIPVPVKVKRKPVIEENK